MGICMQGEVLEISAGTGRNMPYYPYDKISKLTFTDLSHGMLTQVSKVNRNPETVYSLRGAHLGIVS